MMEHENTKEARRKLQEYKQKLGKEFFVEFFHRSTRYFVWYFIGLLDHITWTNRCCCSALFYWWFTPILHDHFKLLLTHILLAFLHRPVWRGFVALTVTYFHWRYWIFFVFFSSSSRSQQGKPRTDAESVGRGNVNFFTEFYFSFLRIKRCGRCR